MPIEIKTSEDGSHTLYSSDFGETYHSSHGALTESMHVFIQNGLDVAFETFSGTIRVLEIGLGTGLNAALAFDRANECGRVLDYVGLEKYPPDDMVLGQLNFGRFSSSFKPVSDIIWDVRLPVGGNSLLKRHLDFIHDDWEEEPVHVIFFDAFAPKSHPQAWDPAFIQHTLSCLLPGGIWVTYAANGALKTAIRQAGYHPERLKGPPGKNHMIRVKVPH